jgi:KDO2-lipid IV(A) lauroyltransferase
MANKNKPLIWLEYIIAKPFLVLPRVFSYKTNTAIGRALGWFAYYLVGSARKVSLRNLEIAFGTAYSLDDRKRITKEVFRNMGLTALELIHFPKLGRGFFANRVTVRGEEHVITALKQGKGLILCGVHMGNWELSAAWMAMHGYTVNAIVRLLDNPLLDEYVENFRRNKGVVIIPKQYAPKRGIKALRNNEILLVLIDQNAAVNGTFVPFFNISASTMRGVPFFHHATDAPVICIYQIRKDDGTHLIVFSEIQNMSGDTNRDLTSITAYYESVIRQYPGNWLWVHPRWKKRPAGEKGLYPGLRV